MKTTFVLAACLAILSFAPAGNAQNLVANGDFETGDFTGWDQFGDMSYTQVFGQGQPLTDGNVYPVADGQYSAAFGPGNAFGGITQFVNTIPGVSYNVSFDLANTDTQGIDNFIFSFDDGFQVMAAPFPPFNYSFFSVPVTASGTTADVSFFFYNPFGYFLLDDVSVTPAIPEPESWSLLLAGFAVIGTSLRRRKPFVAVPATVAI